MNGPSTLTLSEEVLNERLYLAHFEQQNRCEKA